MSSAPPTATSVAARVAAPAVTFQPVAAASRSHHVERALLDLMAQGQLPAGSRLPTEQALALQFGVSRATVREAIARLRADGLLSTKPGRGAVVEAVTSQALRLQGSTGPGSFAHLFELRRVIEVEAAALAAQRRDAVTLAAIVRAHKQMQAAARAGRYAPEADLAFHRAVAAATANPHLLSLLDFIGQQLDRLLASAWVNSARVAGGAHEAQAEHAVLLEAIAAADPKQARRAAAAHLTAAQQRLQRAAPAAAANAAAAAP